MHLREVQVKINKLDPIRRIKDFFWNIYRGVKAGYPPCCVLEYSIDELRGINYQPLGKGFIEINGKVSGYVPCILHRLLFKRVSYEETLYKSGLQLIIGNDPKMPEIRCWKCGEEYRVDSDIGKAVVACPNCKATSKIKPAGTYGTSYVKYDVERESPDVEEDLEGYYEKLSDIELSSLIEAARCIGVEANTASELMSFRVLESITRRLTGIYNWKEGLEELEKNYQDLAHVIDYFRVERNKVAHPEKISDKTDAESTYKMCIRLIKQILS